MTNWDAKRWRKKQVQRNHIVGAELQHRDNEVEKEKRRRAMYSKLLAAYVRRYGDVQHGENRSNH